MFVNFFLSINEKNWKSEFSKVFSTEEFFSSLLSIVDVEMKLRIKTKKLQLLSDTVSN